VSEETPGTYAEEFLLCYVQVCAEELAVVPHSTKKKAKAESMRSSHCGYLQYLCLFNAFISDPARSAYKNNTVCTWNCCQFSPLQDGIFSWETKSIENVYKTFLRHSSQNSVNSSSRREQRVYSALWEMISSQVCYCWLCHHLTLAAEQQCHSWDGLNSSRLK